MNYRSLITIFVISTAMAFASAASAQPAISVERLAASAEPKVMVDTVEPSYDVELQLLVGSNDPSAPKGEMPANLTSLSKQIRSAMPFSNYRLASTFLGRLASDGTFEYKSLSNIFGQEIELRSQTFLEWSLARLRNLPTAKGGQGYQAQAFRFGARVPVVVGTGKDENGKPIQATNFEQIGLNLSKVGVVENVPTLIGTLNLPGANGTLFLVMTIKSVDM